MSYYESGFWHEWFDYEALEGEQFDSDLYLKMLGEAAIEGDYGGAEDGLGNISSDADPGL